MRLLEFEAKDILKKYGIELPAGRVVSAADGFNFTTPVMLKAQVPIGGRGKAGGVIAVDCCARCSIPWRRWRHRDSACHWCPTGRCPPRDPEAAASGPSGRKGVIPVPLYDPSSRILAWPGK